MIQSLGKLAVSGARSFLWRLVRGALFWKYVLLFVTVTGTALVASNLIDIWFTYREHRQVLVQIQAEQAAAAATRISQFIKEIEAQLGWTTHLSWSSPAMEQRQLDGLRLLRQVPAITELAQIDDRGKEQLRLSRQAMDRIASNADFSLHELFTTANVNKHYYGPVYFRRETEPYMTLAVAGARKDAGVSVAEVNLKHIWDVVHQIRVGRTGQAYVIDARGRLIAHPDISLVLRRTDMSQLAHVRAAREGAGGEPALVSANQRGERVLTAHARADPLDWLVFVELPEREANEPLRAALARSLFLVLAGLPLAFLAALILSRRMVGPIETLTAGARRIGRGALDHRIEIATGDELEALGNQFNRMAAELQSSYATLERKVEERTRQLQTANLAKSRFLAAASHDLRQPLHALNLFVAQLRAETDPAERRRLAARIGTAVTNMNELFNALLDISKLDAGALTASITDFSVDTVLQRIDAMFAAAAREKGLHFRVVHTRAWTQSDAILLERVLINLVSNAIRYTHTGGIVVGCRRLSGGLRIDVCDSGIGIAKELHNDIFGEFVRVSGKDLGSRDAGLGLGLAIVERLCALLGHAIHVASIPGKGSRFSVVVPMVPARRGRRFEVTGVKGSDPLVGKLVIVIDDDELILESTSGLLTGWGCRVVAARTSAEAIAALRDAKPDLLISDFHLGGGQSGVVAIAELQRAAGAVTPALLISGDTSPERLNQAKASGHHLLHKPVRPMSLRAMMSRLLNEI